MICARTFKHKYREDFNSIEEWCDFVNSNYEYEKNKSKTFDWLGKCIPSELNSTHPYYVYLSKVYKLKTIYMHLSNLEECKKDPSRIKYLYNASSTLDTIRNKIKELKKDYENYYTKNI